MPPDNDDDDDDCQREARNDAPLPPLYRHLQIGLGKYLSPELILFAGWLLDDSVHFGVLRVNPFIKHSQKTQNGLFKSHTGRSWQGQQELLRICSVYLEGFLSSLYLKEVVVNANIKKALQFQL